MRVIKAVVGTYSDWPEAVSELNAVDGLSDGVTLVVARERHVESCHGLALAIGYDALRQRGLRKLVAYSSRQNLLGNFLSFSCGDGFLNRWVAKKDDLAVAKRSKDAPLALHYGVSEPLFVEEMEKRLRRDLWPFGPKIILADVECWRLPALENLETLARSRHRKILVTTSLPIAPSGGPPTQESIALALESATGMHVDNLAHQILSISEPIPDRGMLRYEVGVITV